MLDNSGYRHTLRICNSYCFFTATVVTWTLLNVTFIRTLPALLNICVWMSAWYYEIGHDRLKLSRRSPHIREYIIFAVDTTSLNSYNSNSTRSCITCDIIGHGLEPFQSNCRSVSLSLHRRNFQASLRSINWPLSNRFANRFWNNLFFFVSCI
jgi:hypothetical protein